MDKNQPDDHLIKDFEDWEEERKGKPIFIKILSIFMLILVVGYLITNPITRNILFGLIESSSIEEDSNNEYIVEIDSENKLFFMNNTYNNLIKIYDENPEKEFKVCLQGNVTNGDYFIHSIYEPTMSFQSHNKVIADPCPDNTLVSMHSHPFRHCLPSEQDLSNFKLFKKINPDALMAIMCERGRFNFYRNP